MSADELSRGETITEGWRAFDLFTDRHEAIRLFASYLNDDPPRDRILFFHGDGGIGKSLLMRVLHEQYCKRPGTTDDWEYLQELDDDGFTDGLKNRDHVERVPSVLIDFGLAPRDVDRPREKYYAPLMIRRELAAFGLKFPLFDFAHVWYLHRKRRLSKDRLKELFPDEEIGFLTTIADAISGHPIGAIAQAVFSLFGKHLGHRYLKYKQSRGLAEGDVEAIRRMDPDKELIDQLPSLLALDINAAMTQRDAPPRLALLFDTHEAFWGEERNLPADIHSERDEWLRRLLATLDLTRGIVAVLAGREPPRWDEPSRVVILGARLDLQLIDHLSDAHAAEFLERARCADGLDRDLSPALVDPALRQAMIDLARVAPDQVHPYYLGFCIDMAFAAFRKGEPLTPEMLADDEVAKDKNEQIVQRLLRYVEPEVAEAVRSLAAARAFDETIYHELGAALKFATSAPAFRSLIRFSFVWKASGRGDGWFRIHDLLRRLLQDDGDPVTGHAHAVLEEYFRRGLSADNASIAEAIYHANRREPQRGCREWRGRFDQARTESRYGLCRALLEVRSELKVTDTFAQGSLSQSEGDYYAGLALHDVAQTEYLEAIEAYDSVLQIAPGNAGAHTNRGNALASLGDLQSHLSRHEEAAASFAAAVAAFDRALQIAPDRAEVHTNRGNALRSLGDLRMGLARHAEAEVTYADAVQSFDRALQIAADDATAHNNRGVAFRGLGYLQSRLARYGEAEATYANALAAFDNALRIAPNFTAAQNNRGLVLWSLGDLQSDLARYGEAEVRYIDAVQSFDLALQIAPDDGGTHNNRGLVLASLGALQSSLGRHDKAEARYTDAVQSLDRALQIAPNLAAAHNNRGNALGKRGDSQLELARHVEAESSYIAAVAAFHSALQLAPDDAQVHNNLGNVLRSFGAFLSRLRRHGEAEASYVDAVAAYNRAMQIAPDYAAARNNRGGALADIGDLQVGQGRLREAERSYAAAVAAFDGVLQLAINDVAAHNNRGISLAQLGDLQSRLGLQGEAEVSYAAAVAAFDRVLHIAPRDTSALWNKAHFLGSMGASLRSNSPSEARQLLEQALKCLHHLREITPGDPKIEEPIQALERIIGAMDQGSKGLPPDNP